MSRFSVEQRRLTYRGRVFHFVSYDGVPANARRGEPGTAPAWWLVDAPRRWEVMPFEPGQDVGDLDRAFTEWLEVHVFENPTGNGD